MAEDKILAEAKTEPGTYAKIIFNVASGLLLSGGLYFLSAVGSYLLLSKADVYFADLPVAETGKQQKLLLVDNYSRDEIKALDLSFAGIRPTVGFFRNVESATVSPAGSEISVLRLQNILPNRQAAILIATDAPLSDESFRLVSAPVGVSIISKTRLTQSIFDYASLVPMGLSFIFYVAAMSYFDRRVALLTAEGNKLTADIESGRKERDLKVAEMDARLKGIQEALAKTKIVYVKRIINLSKENEFWRDIFKKALQTAVLASINADAVIALVLKKIGIELQKSLRQMEEGELLQIIEEAEARLDR